MSKITFIGGGSAKFVRELVVDLFTFPALRSAHICLMDIDRERVERAERIVAKIIRDRRLSATVEATTDRERALAGADYVVITIMVGGLAHYESDGTIPAKYGVCQCVGDTIGPGGVFRCVRTTPVLRDIAADLQRLAPQAWVLNYANPMAMNVATMLACGHDRSVGLCHSMQYGVLEIARWLDVPAAEIQFTSGGINHINFYLTLERAGQNLYPALLAAADRVIAGAPVERVRFELLRYLGHWPAEGPYHQAEYYPWFKKDVRRIEHYAADNLWGYTRDALHYRQRTEEIEAQLAGQAPISYERSVEYGADIIHAFETGQPFRFYGNIRNAGFIDNLPAGAVVEVSCVAGRAGLVPECMGRIPAQLAAVMTPHIAIHEMAVQAALTKNLTLLRQAVQADPLTAAILTLPEIERMTDELLTANAEYVKDWQ